MEWNRKINEISTKMKKRVNHAHGMWITHLNFAVYVFYITQIQNQSEKRLIFIFYSLPLEIEDFPRQNPSSSGKIKLILLNDR